MRGDCNSQDLFLLHSLTQLYTGGDQETTAALYKMSPDQPSIVSRLDGDEIGYLRYTRSSSAVSIIYGY